jgi:hypothetical protein
MPLRQNSVSAEDKPTPTRTRQRDPQASRDTTLLPNPPAEDASKSEWALAYAEQLGWPVFPCNEFKEPLTVHGFEDATTDLAALKRWWAKHPNANIGFYPGPASIAVIDLDPGHDMAMLELSVGKLPETRLEVRRLRKAAAISTSR